MNSSGGAELRGADLRSVMAAERRDNWQLSGSLLPTLSLHAHPPANCLGTQRRLACSQTRRFVNWVLFLWTADASTVHYVFGIFLWYLDQFCADPSQTFRKIPTHAITRTYFSSAYLFHCKSRVANYSVFSELFRFLCKISCFGVFWFFSILKIFFKNVFLLKITQLPLV